MERYTGSTLVLTSITGMVWAIALLGLEPSWTVAALAAGCGGVATATLALVNQRRAWDRMQRTIDDLGPFVLSFPPALGFVVGALLGLATTSLSALFRPEPVPTPTAVVVGAIGGLALWTWNRTLDDEPLFGPDSLGAPTSRAAPNRNNHPTTSTSNRTGTSTEKSTANAGVGDGVHLQDESGSIRIPSTGSLAGSDRCNYDGHLHLDYDDTTIGAIVGAVNLRFAPTRIDRWIEMPDPAIRAVLVVDDGVDADLVPFTITARTTAPLRLLPTQVRLVVPAHNVSSNHRINLLFDPDAAAVEQPETDQQVLAGFDDRDLSYAGAIIRIEVSQAGRRVQLAELTIPSQTSPTSVWHMTHPRSSEIGHY